MDYNEILKNARECSGPYCKACPVCNGMACRTQVPGPGGKGTAATMLRNYQKWQEVCINMDTICENAPIDTTFTLFGRKFAAPIFAAPVGAMKLHYGDKYDDLTYNDILVSSCAQAGIAAFTGDGTNPAVMEGALHAITAAGGLGVPTVKPWNMETVFAKLDAVRRADPMAVAMDIDAAGLPFLKGLTPPAGSKTVEELRQIIDYAQKPFIVKGVMTVRGALKALEAGASGIVVSNHGGRGQRHRGVQPRRPGPGSVSLHGGGAARHRRRGGRQADHPGGRRPAQRHGHLQSPGHGRGRRAHRPSLRHHGLWRRGRGPRRAGEQAPGGAGGHHGHVRCPQPGGDPPGHAVRVLILILDSKIQSRIPCAGRTHSV